MASAKPTGSNEVDSADDPELNALLESTLADFDKLAATENSEDTKAKAPESDASTKGISKNKASEAQPSKEEEAFQSMFGDEKLLMEQFSQLRETASKLETSDPEEISQTLAKTLESLSKNIDSMESEISQSHPAAAMPPFPNDDSFPDPSGVMPLMRGMMQTLLSKELLYPTLKEIVGLYPDYLRDNESKLSSDDVTRYKSQMDVMQKMVDEYEKESPDEQPEVANERFDNIMRLMEEMQTLGKPPSEIVSDFPLDMPFGNLADLGAFPDPDSTTEQPPENCAVS